jgi:hypothetical protein
VLAIAYRSDSIVGISCGGDDACFEATRVALVTGTPQPGAGAQLNATIQPTEGIYARTALALAYLVAAQPAAGWSQYLVPGGDPRGDPAAAIAWSKLVVMGHSQGGGHALLLAKLQPIARLVTLSSPCDSVAGTPASWQAVDPSWRSQPSQIGFGFASSADTTCPAYAAIWTAIGMTAAHRFEDAVACPGASTHTATTQCVANIGRVQQLLAF